MKRPSPLFSPESEHWETLGFGLWLVAVRNQDLSIGYVGLSVPTFLPEVLPAVEVGWRLDPDAWGRGYATEAAAVALACAFQRLNLDEVVSLPQVDNLPSVKVAEKIGMRLKRTTTVPATDRRGPVEVAVMVISREDWEKSSSVPRSYEKEPRGGQRSRSWPAVRT